MLPDPTPKLLRTTLKPLVGGLSKIIVDINNPWIMGRGLPADGPQSSIEVYRGALDDDTASWCTGYKTNYWYTILPDSPTGDVVEMVGDAACKSSLSALVKAHGFTATDLGGYDDAAALEWRFTKGKAARVQSGEQFVPGK